MHFTATFRVTKPAQAVLDYAADFRNLPQWDPSIVDVQMLSDEPVELGSQFSVTLKFLGFDSVMKYEVVEWTPGKRAVLRGTTPVATAIDTITVSTTDKTTTVTWALTIHFVFPISLFDLAFAALFRSTAMDAVRGLQRVLRNLRTSTRSATATS
mgnify:CR=1 FL=1